MKCLHLAALLLAVTTPAGADITWDGRCRMSWVLQEVTLSPFDADGSALAAPPRTRNSRVADMEPGTVLREMRPFPEPEGILPRPPRERAALPEDIGEVVATNTLIFLDDFPTEQTQGNWMTGRKDWMVADRRKTSAVYDVEDGVRELTTIRHLGAERFWMSRYRMDRAHGIGRKSIYHGTLSGTEQ